MRHISAALVFLYMPSCNTNETIVTFSTTLPNAGGMTHNPCIHFSMDVVGGLPRPLTVIFLVGDIVDGERSERVIKLGYLHNIHI